MDHNTDNKTNIYIDCDDTILDSSKTIVNILNTRYNLSKSINDVKDWQYRSIFKDMNTNLVKELYDSDEFWNSVTLKPEFIKFYKQYQNRYNWIIVTKGTPTNLLKKEIFINNFFDTVVFHGIKICEEFEESKNIIDMSDGIQIDDVVKNLQETNAGIKILLTNGLDLSWNKVKPNIENLYSANNWIEIEQIITFFNNNKEFII